MPGDGFADAGAPAEAQADAVPRFEPIVPDLPDLPDVTAQDLRDAPGAPEDPDELAPLFDPAEHLQLLLRRFAGRLERHRWRRDPAQRDAGRVFTIERRLAAFEAEIEARVARS